MTRTWRYIKTEESLVKAVRIIKSYLKQECPNRYFLAGLDVKPRPLLGIDVETYRPDGDKKKMPRAIWNGEDWEGKIRTIQIGLDPTVPDWEIRDLQFIIDVRQLGEKVVGAALRSVLHGGLFLCQGGKYDLPFLDVFLAIVPEAVFDTLYASQIYWSGDRRNHSLGDQYQNFMQRMAPGLFESLTGMDFKSYKDLKKEMQKSDWRDELTRKQLQYAADDVRLLFYLHQCQKDGFDREERKHESNFPEWKGMRAIARLEYEIMPVYANMEQYGIAYDEEYHKEVVIPLMEKMQRKAARRCERFPELLKHRPPGSRELIFEQTNGDIDKDQVKYAKRFFAQMFSNFGGLSFKTKKKKSGNTVTISWFDGPTEEEALPIVRSCLAAKDGWRQIRDRLISTNSDALKVALSQALGMEVEERSEKYLRNLIDHKDKDNPKWDIIKAVLDYNKACNYVSKYGRGLLEFSINGYVYPTWNQIGTEHNELVSGRNSVKDPPIHQMAARDTLYEWAGKQHGILAAELLRPLFIAEDGCILVCADYSQIEPRYTAEFSGDAALRSVFLDGKDQHSMTAQFIMGLKEPPGKDDWRRNDFGKTINLAMTYGMSAWGLGDRIAIKTRGKMPKPSKEQAQEWWDGYWDLYCGVKDKIDKTEAKITRNLRKVGSLAPFKGSKPFGRIETALGRPRRFCLTPEQERMYDAKLRSDFNPYGEGWYYNEFRRRIAKVRRAGFNHIIQGTCADMLKLAELYIWKRVKKLGWDISKNRIIIVMHDEIVFQAEEQYKEEAVRVVQESMERAAKFFLKVVPVKINLGVGRNWYEAGAEAKA